MLVKTAEIIELGVSVVVFALSLAGFIHSKSALKALSADADEKTLKKCKKHKKLFFVGIVFSVWLVLGVLLKAFSGI